VLVKITERGAGTMQQTADLKVADLCSHQVLELMEDPLAEWPGETRLTKTFLV